MNSTLNNKVSFFDLGLIDYEKAWHDQENLFKYIVDIKIANRNKPIPLQQITPNYLILCEHPHVYTLGKSGDKNNLLVNEEDLDVIAASFHHINRGGDITYHGPGQIICYPILDLENFFTDIHQYMRNLEECVIRTMAEYGLMGTRIPGLTGVWLDVDDHEKTRKICALGVRASRWVTMHGFSFNVNTDLNYFDHIIPCGIADKKITSLGAELGRQISMNEVKEKLLSNMADIFQMELETAVDHKLIT